MDHAAEACHTDLMTITRFVLNEQSRYPESRGDLTILLSHIVLGCKYVCSAVNKAGLAKLTGLAGETNVQGEEQKKLDVLSNEVFINALKSSGRSVSCTPFGHHMWLRKSLMIFFPKALNLLWQCILVSEEIEEAIFVEPSKRGRYIVVFDPLDGSSNIDCGVSIGTIFGIYMMKDKHEPTLDDVLQCGTSMLAAGYCMYGSSCMFVLSTGFGINGFTLDPSLGEFILTHPEIKVPKKGKIYSVNEGNAKDWDAPTAKYVEKCKFPKDGSSPKSLRYVGSMVADIHRTLLYGGIFLYPADTKNPTGKLRVLYEVFPMSFLMEQAGGQSFTGKQRALDLVPTQIHGRSPIFLGSYDDVEEIKALYFEEEQKE
ncbi:fructose-1,6-bisphosphatase, cytosolic-like isoform X1 [Telopea speciosissima]|uniref:fructose-1,6-bisphosphatase, cytosolic-like isoform X1 n=1 Tax=Telopea speciosissima TaxID=54955 RepID=UPI001CC5C010|nr:fructose-1,6-bisphosphatase, cytosolic-like isoform X1 [Telopea speciosissima]